MNNEDTELLAKMAKDQMEIITSATARLQELAASAGSGRFPDETSRNTVCNLASKVAELASRHAEDRNTGAHHGFAARAHALAGEARDLWDDPDNDMKRYHYDASDNHDRVAQALGNRQASPTIHSTSVGSPA